MDFVNETELQAGWTLGFEPDGRELLVVAIKGTFLILKDGEEPVLAETQVPLTEADEFTGEPGLSAMRYETDYAHRKPRCDVLLNGCAYAPGGRPAERVTVAMRLGTMTKSFDVVGDRVWDGYSSTPTPPMPFEQLPITYDLAFGGVDVDVNDPEKIATYLKNPIGVGYYPLTRGKSLAGKPLPNTEEIGHPVRTTSGNYLPMSFGPVGRNFKSRFPLAGTYNKEWLESKAPFWPDDFNYLYFQAAPADQQIPYPKGGELLILKNLSPQGVTKFQVPCMSMPLLFIHPRGKDLQVNAVIDTIVIEPDKAQVMLTWRTSLPLRRNCFEIKQLVVGAAAMETQQENMKPCGGC
jgi:hypothetical protein